MPVVFPVPGNMLLCLYGLTSIKSVLLIANPARPTSYTGCRVGLFSGLAQVAVGFVWSRRVAASKGRLCRC